MNVTKIFRLIALTLLVLLLVAAPWVGLRSIRGGWPDTNDWIHTFCLAQTVLIAACAVYGPGKFIVRVPLVVAWGLAIGFALASDNLITTQGRVSLAAGAILVVSGTLSALIIFAIHGWRTGACLEIGKQLSAQSIARSRHQLSLQMLMVLTAAFAVAGVVARTAITAPPDPFGAEHDILWIHAWLGFFPSLAVAPALLVVFRPSWKIVLAGVFFVLVTLADPLSLALAARVIFEDKNFFPMTTWWDTFSVVEMAPFYWHGSALVAVVTYALLARAAGFRMVVPNQSNDKNPKPSAQPATEAGRVQD